MMAAFILFSQFYIFSSGGVQPGFAIAAIMAALVVPGIKTFRNDAKKKFVYGSFIAFVVYGLFINLYWSFSQQDGVFLIASVYYIFNFLIFISICEIFESEDFNLLFKAVAVSVILLFGLAVAGVGRYDFFPRYNGFFNDPNQMAFWALCLVSIAIIFHKRFTHRFHLDVIFISCVMIIYYSQSRSALFGMVFVSLGYLLARIQQSKGRVETIIGIIGLAVLVFTVFPRISIGDISSAPSIFDRLQETNLGEQSEVRGYHRLVDYPEMLIFGAGQGLDGRFMADGEMHSTWAGIWFYYGIIGLGLFLAPLIRIGWSLSFVQKLAFVGPLLYGFSTFGARTPIFWVFLAFALLATTKFKSPKVAPSRHQNPMAHPL